MQSRRRLLLGALVVIALGVFCAPSLWLHLVTEPRMRRTIAEADRMTIRVPSVGTDWDRAKMKEIVVTDPAQLAALKRDLLGHSGHGGGPPRQDKCFEGWERRSPYDAWPHIIFTAPGRRPVKVWLPLGDCQVWPEGLPWGWSSVGDFMVRIDRLAGPF